MINNSNSNLSALFGQIRVEELERWIKNRFMSKRSKRRWRGKGHNPKYEIQFRLFFREI